MTRSLTRRAALALAAAPWAAARAPRFSETDLFRQGDAGVHTYRIPALVETRRRTLIAVVDARHDSTRDLPAHISLAMRRSLDGGRTWEPARFLRQVPGGAGVGDPSLLLDRRTGRVWCFHAYGPPGIGSLTAEPGAVTGPRTLQVHAIHSDDDGRSWSEPADLTPQLKDPAWKAIFATSGTHFQTRSGRYLVPIVVRYADRSLSSWNAYSDDAGRTWRMGARIAAGTDESHAVELADGEVLQNMRAKPRRMVARSRDGGATFDAATPDPALVDPSCNAGLAVCRRGVVVFTNAASDKRERLTVRLSYDGGRSWPAARVLHEGPAAYSTVVPLRDGALAVLYERGDTQPYERITFARFDVAWVAAPSISHERNPA
jgi:sialidase-1